MTKKMTARSMKKKSSDDESGRKNRHNSISRILEFDFENDNDTELWVVKKVPLRMTIKREATTTSLAPRR
jgi:hypothetical protein